MIGRNAGHLFPACVPLIAGPFPARAANLALAAPALAAPAQAAAAPALADLLLSCP